MVKAVLFDWDGTLFDVFDFLVETYTQVFNEIGVQPWSRRDFKTRFRCDWRSMLGEMGLENHVDFLIDKWDQKKQDKIETLKLHPGVNELLNDLSKDYTLGIVSSAPKNALMEEVKRFQVEGYFKIIISHDDVQNPKPHPEPLNIATKKLDIPVKDCVYIGDMIEDIQASKNAGMKSIAVSWGIHSKTILEAENPDKLVNSTSELLEYIRSMP